MIDLIADWTTAGPYKNLTWVTILFTAVVIVALIFVTFEFWDSWKTYRAVTKGGKNGRFLLLAESSVRRSVGRIVIQLVFLTLASVAISISVTQDRSHLYWYRVAFVSTFLVAEVVSCLLIVNDVVTRHRLEKMIQDSFNKEP